MWVTWKGSEITPFFLPLPSAWPLPIARGLGAKACPEVPLLRAFPPMVVAAKGNQSLFPLCCQHVG